MGIERRVKMSCDNPNCKAELVEVEVQVGVCGGNKELNKRGWYVGVFETRPEGGDHGKERSVYFCCWSCYVKWCSVIGLHTIVDCVNVGKYK